MSNPLPRKPKFVTTEGLVYSSLVPPENIRSALAYNPKADDIFLVTYPKCGNIWVQQILTLILNDGEIPERLEKTGLYPQIVFLEKFGASAAEQMVRPGIITTHLPFYQQLYNPEAKYIVALRNPKDACVSFYYHTTMFPCYEYEDASFHDYFKYWINGETECGSYFDWVLSWWEHKNEPNLLILIYEDMKTDLKKNILKIASFLGKEYENKLLSNPQILDNVLEKSSLDFMKKATNQLITKRHKVLSGVDEKKFEFIRKGIVGDWRIHFTKEENQQMKAKFDEKFNKTGLETLWDDYGVFDENNSFSHV